MVSVTEFDDSTMVRIFSSILRWFLLTRQFNGDLLKFEAKIIQATLDFQKSVAKDLLPTPLKSHYLFNLRDFAKVVFGLC
jgi:dynein heavy chain